MPGSFSQILAPVLCQYRDREVVVIITNTHCVYLCRDGQAEFDWAASYTTQLLCAGKWLLTSLISHTCDQDPCITAQPLLARY